jgi:hypothetical protein
MVIRLSQAVTITYQLQRRRCGRATCRVCREGAGHGPYWYAYWRGSDKKLRATYIGKVLPPGVTLSPLQQRRRALLPPLCAGQQERSE